MPAKCNEYRVCLAYEEHMQVAKKKIFANNFLEKCELFQNVINFCKSRPFAANLSTTFLTIKVCNCETFAL